MNAPRIVYRHTNRPCHAPFSRAHLRGASSEALLVYAHYLWGRVDFRPFEISPHRYRTYTYVILPFRRASPRSSDALLMTLGAGTETLGRAVRYVASHEGTTHEHPGLYV